MLHTCVGLSGRNPHGHAWSAQAQKAVPGDQGSCFKVEGPLVHIELIVRTGSKYNCLPVGKDHVNEEHDLGTPLGPFRASPDVSCQFVFAPFRSDTSRFWLHCTPTTTRLMRIQRDLQIKALARADSQWLPMDSRTHVLPGSLVVIPQHILTPWPLLILTRKNFMIDSQAHDLGLSRRLDEACLINQALVAEIKYSRQGCDIELGQSLV